MSYRCSFCNGKVPHGIPLRRYTVYRPNWQIASERPICWGCAESVGLGKVPVQYVQPAKTMTVRPATVQRFGVVPQQIGSLVLTVPVPPKAVPVPVPKSSPVKGKVGAVGVGLAATLKNGKITK